MGYTTYFSGSFEATPALNADQVKELQDFSSDRHSASDFPGYWCDWTSTDDGTAIKWNESEKFYDYEEWIKYLITNVLNPWGIKLNGEVTWDGEDSGDHGKICISNSIVTTKHGRIVYGQCDESWD